MAKTFVDFHHFKGNTLTPFEKVEKKAIELLLNSKISDKDRESSMIWELKHVAGCAQIGRIVAQKRKLDMDIAATASMIHDIYVIVHGNYKDHAKLGAPIAKKLLEDVGGFSKKQIETIVLAVAHHSEKEIYSDNPYVELVKDVDTFDCSLYRGAEGYYRLHKPKQIVDEYVKRLVKVRKELNLPAKPIFA